MRACRRLSLVVPVLVTGMILSAGHAESARFADAYGKLPISFEVNQGQADPQASFVAHGSRQTLLVSATGIVVGGNGDAARSVRLSFVHANSDACVEGLEPLDGKVNYFVGSDPSRWRTSVPTFGKVRLEDVYPGIDVIVYGNQQRLEFDFVVSPGADLSQIRLKLDGAGGNDSPALEVDDAGELRVDAGRGMEMVLGKPSVYQISYGTRRRVEGGFFDVGNGQIGFWVNHYDLAEPLVIDPILEYSTFLGGTNAAIAYGIAVDAKGCAYVTGEAWSTDFTVGLAAPNRYGGGGMIDAFVCKFNTKGNALKYVTYLGGSDVDWGRRIAVDSRGNAYVVGITLSTNFPTLHAFQSVYGGLEDGFVVKLLADGSLDYSTYLGGSGQEDNFPCGIAVDADGCAYVAGSTSSTNFPVTAGAYQTSLGGPLAINAFVSKLSPKGGGLVYSTYLGGSEGDFGYGIAVDKVGNAYVCGFTWSTNFPTVNAWQPTIHPSDGDDQTGDAFVAKLNSSGSALVYSTYFGGTGDDGAEAIAVDEAGDAYFAGSTTSADFPVVNPLQADVQGRDAYVAKLDPTGTNLLYSINIGGSGSDAASDVAIDTAGDAYITGTTESEDFPVTNAVQPVARVGGTGSFDDAFVVKLDPTGSAFVYSTYLGGMFDDEGNGIAIDQRGDAYVTGFSASPDFPLVQPYQSSVGGSFVAKIHDTPAPPDHDFAIQAIRAPKNVVLSAKSSGKTRRVIVRLQNMSDHNETIATLNVLTNLLSLSVNGCGGNQPVLLEPTHPFPIILRPLAIFDVAFAQLFEPCTGLYVYSASVNSAALDGIPDSNTTNDVCPRRPVVSEGGTIIDPGCGNRYPDRSLGADVTTLVRVRY